jgi:hypothetical protein
MTYDDYIYDEAIKEQKALADLEARQPHGAMAPLPSATPV